MNAVFHHSETMVFHAFLSLSFQLMLEQKRCCNGNRLGGCAMDGCFDSSVADIAAKRLALLRLSNSTEYAYTFYYNGCLCNIILTSYRKGPLHLYANYILSQYGVSLHQFCFFRNTPALAPLHQRCRMLK